MVHDRCIFITSIHPSRTCTSGSFEPMRRNPCVHRLDLGLYSHPKEFWGNGVRTHVNSRGKSPLSKKKKKKKKSPPRRIESTTLHQAGQRAQNTTNELFRSPNKQMNGRMKRRGKRNKKRTMSNHTSNVVHTFLFSIMPA